MKKIFVVARKFRGTPLQKVSKGKYIVTRMTGNVYFPNPNPSLAAVSAAIDDVEKAHENSLDGAKTATAILRAKEIALDVIIRDLSHYVESVANQNGDEGEEVIISAGMDVREKGARKEKTFEVKQASIPGTVVASTKSGGIRTGYVWQYTTDQTDENNWKYSAFSVYPTNAYDELETGKRYWFRVAVVDKAGQGPWSHPVSLILQ